MGKVNQFLQYGIFKIFRLENDLGKINNILKWDFDRVENFVGKGETANHQNFQKLSDAKIFEGLALSCYILLLMPPKQMAIVNIVQTDRGILNGSDFTFSNKVFKFKISIFRTTSKILLKL